jgi:hypothetical protein
MGICGNCLNFHSTGIRAGFFIWLFRLPGVGDRKRWSSCADFETYNVGMRLGSRRGQILALLAMALAGVCFGIWLFRDGFIELGCLWIALFVWSAQQFAVWLIAPFRAPSDVTPPLTSGGQRLLLSVICVLGAGVCAVGVYLWHMWPEEWQAGLVFILFGLLVLAPVTVKEIQSRRRAQAGPMIVSE